MVCKHLRFVIILLFNITVPGCHVPGAMQQMDTSLHGQPLQLEEVVHSSLHGRVPGAWSCPNKRARDPSIDNPTRGEKQGCCREAPRNDHGGKAGEFVGVSWPGCRVDVWHQACSHPLDDYRVREVGRQGTVGVENCHPEEGHHEVSSAKRHWGIQFTHELDGCRQPTPRELSSWSMDVSAEMVVGIFRLVNRCCRSQCL